MKKRIIKVFISSLIILVGLGVFVNANNKQDVSVCKGIEFIKSLELKDVVKLEEKIDSLREKDIEDMDFKTLFSSSVIMGDSITEGLVGYGVLNQSSVVAKKGKNTISALEDVKTVVNLQPRKVFMTYGMNDLYVFPNNAKGFIDSYKNLVNEVKLSLPSTKIYIASILPANEKALNKDSELKHCNEFNKELEKMCEELDLIYIDTTKIVKEDSKLYEPDGIHMKISFYPKWLNLFKKSALL